MSHLREEKKMELNKKELEIMRNILKERLLLAESDEENLVPKYVEDTKALLVNVEWVLNNSFEPEINLLTKIEKV